MMGNTTDTSELRDAALALSDDALEAARRNWGVSDDAMVGLFCGSIYPEKHIDFLVNAARLVRASVSNFELIIAGGGPQAQMAREFADRTDWIHYVGPVFGAEKAACFKLAKLFLNPGLVGLSVVDALCTGLPVLTTDLPIHSPEIEYLEHGVNAVVTPFDAGAYSQAVISLLTEPASFQALIGGVHSSAEAFSVDAMVENIAAGVLACLGDAGTPLGQGESKR